MDREGSLDIGERRNDDPPDAFRRIERKDAVVAIDEAPHHLGFPCGSKRRTGLLRLLNFDEPVDDLAALHQEAMHLLIDAVDLAAQFGKRGRFGM